ncbi:TonB-dependent receptor domain-containing protein [Chryseobacterium sp. MP_3.2]|uniref:TonB-dependent receptor domain-containing protein n=1 Tax=Chryseobacterium sp. MP_3.2 TaxID=3071712 RepID=UPI002DFCAF4D|nr:iron complex outermembrane receptor protein [Chryseobacterium sp. MP_3.2]
MINKIEFSSIIRTKTLVLTFVLGAASLAFAQEKINVTGKIVSKENNAVPYASVTFSNKANKLFSDAALTDEKGDYQLALTPGNYDITIEAIDYQKATLNRKISSAGNLGNFSVEAESSVTNTKTSDIQGVVITSTTKPYRVEIDKKVYDPSTDLISKGGTLQDVLSNVPSIAVDTDGTVSMRGNSNIKFLINGKPSSLLGIDDGADALKTIPADQIDRIEVITNPSSKYEASGTAGILNIILKKSKKLGFNGSVTGTIGYLPLTSLNTNLSWKKGAWTYYLNGGGGYSKNRSKNNLEYRTLLSDNQLVDNTLLYRRKDGENNGESRNYNANTGFVVDLTEKSSLNASVLFRNFQYESNDQTDIYEKFFQRLAKATTQNDVGVRKNNSFQADLGFDQKIGEKGQLFSLSGSFQNSKGENTTMITENSLTGNTATTIASDVFSTTDNTTYIGKGDYELPLGEKSKIEAGARYDYTKNIYDYSVDQSKNNLPFQPVLDFTSTTTYGEKIAAAYAQFKSKIGNFGYQVGTRVENTNIDISYKNVGTGLQVQDQKSYTGFFPSVFFTYELGKNQLLLNYSRRIQRPRSFFLVPFNSYDSRSIFRGNPDLDPTYENSFELGYSLVTKKITLNPTLYYKKSQDEVNFVQLPILENGNTLIVTQPVNAGSETQYGLDLNATYDPAKWLRLMGSLDLFGYNNTGNFQGVSFEGQGFSSRARLTTTFKPDKNTSLQVQGFYRGAEKTVSNDRKGMYAVSFGASRTILKGDGTLAFNIQDIFNSRAREFTFTGAEYSQYSYNQFSPRQFSLSFTYRFKQGDKVDQPKRKKDINSNSQGGEDGPPM